MKTFTTTLLLSLSLAATGCLAHEDDDEEHKEGRGYLKKQQDVAAVTDPLYKTECGGCHFAYPPGLLPERSWRKIMTRLDRHFGDNAELEPAVQQQLTSYLSQYSADRAAYRRSRRIMRSISGNDAPLRITGLPYFIHEHDEIPPRLIKGNNGVGSLSNCNACHRRAEQGSFREQEIRIPGYGRWDD